MGDQENSSHYLSEQCSQWNRLLGNEAIDGKGYQLRDIAVHPAGLFRLQKEFAVIRNKEEHFVGL